MSKAEGKQITIKFTESINAVDISPPTIDSLPFVTPSGTLTRSNASSSNYNIDKAFDNSTSTYWESSQFAWGKIELANPKAIAGFRHYVISGNAVTGLDLYGSNDDIDYDLIIKIVNTTATGWKEFRFVPTIPYKYYRINVVNKQTTYFRMAEVQFAYFEGISIVVNGNELAWADGPDHNGANITKYYNVKRIRNHPTEPKALLLDTDSFRNVVGNIEVRYFQPEGDLAGVGGFVESFTEIFTPTDLVQGLTDKGGAYGVHELIEASVDGSVQFIYITKGSAYNTEYIEASVSGVIQFIHIDDINP